MNTTVNEIILTVKRGDEEFVQKVSGMNALILEDADFLDTTVIALVDKIRDDLKYG